MQRRAFITGLTGLLIGSAAPAFAQTANAPAPVCYGNELDNYIGGCPVPPSGFHPLRRRAAQPPAPENTFDPDSLLQPPLPFSDKPILDNPAVWRRHSAAPQRVSLSGPFNAGEILIDMRNQYLYYVDGSGSAIKYVIGVGRADAPITGRSSYVYGMYENAPSINGNRGPAAVMGSHALYLRVGERAHPGEDEGLGIHGTNRPDLLGLPDGARRMSMGCIRMHNLDIGDLYNRISLGARVRFFMNNELRPYLSVSGARPGQP